MHCIHLLARIFRLINSSSLLLRYLASTCSLNATVFPLTNILHQFTTNFSTRGILWCLEGTEIHFPPGFWSGPCWRSLQCSPDLLVIWGGGFPPSSPDIVYNEAHKFGLIVVGSESQNQRLLMLMKVTCWPINVPTNFSGHVPAEIGGTHTLMPSKFASIIMSVDVWQAQFGLNLWNNVGVEICSMAWSTAVLGASRPVLIINRAWWLRSGPV